MGSAQQRLDRRIFLAAGVHPDPGALETSPLCGIEVVDGRITRQFATRADARSAAADGQAPATVVDCGDGHLFPGFRDTHIHQLHTGYDLMRPSLADAGSLDDVVTVLRSAADHAEPGDWIYPSRSWHESRLRERRLPTATELDRASTRHPIVVRRGGHVVVANTRALELAGIDRTTPDPPGGTITRDADGTPTGVLLEKPAFARLAALVPEPADRERRAALRTVGETLLASGVTYARDPGIFDFERPVYERANADGELRIRSDVLMRLDTGAPVAAVLDQITGFGRPTGWAGRLRIGGVKLLMDGGVEAAATSFGYATNEHFHGHAFLEPDDLARILGHALDRGWTVGCHAVGDTAVESILTAARRLPADRRGQVTIEHALLATPQQIIAVAELGLHVTLQHPLVYALAENMRHYWGEDPADAVLATAAWLASAASVSGGSDCNIADFDPFRAVWGMETRHVAGGRELGPQHAVSRAQALSLHMGSLAVGRPADLVCVPLDLSACTPDELLTCRPTVTVIGGTIEYDGQGLAS